MKGSKMDVFWNKIMPACISKYSWSKEFSAEMSPKKWQENIAAKVKAMDENEFDLFLACMVMQASKDQMMGVGLTEKVAFFRSLRD